MHYIETIKLKDGRQCVIRNADERDCQETLDLVLRTHAQTDNMLTYPDECGVSVDEESRRLGELAQSAGSIELVAEVDGAIVGSAGFGPVGAKEKLCHRADFGIAVDAGFWGLGIGRGLTRAAIACAREAGYTQLELQALSTNGRACALYESEGFTEYGRNPKGFRTRTGDFQELVLMRLVLD